MSQQNHDDMTPINDALVRLRKAQKAHAEAVEAARPYQSACSEADRELYEAGLAFRKIVDETVWGDRPS